MMNNNEISKTIILLTIVVMLTNCGGHSDLENSVFTADKDNPELPAYSESGFNTFGALYDRAVFKYNTQTVPVKIIVNNDTTSIRFSGQNSIEPYMENDMYVNFGLSDFIATEYSDLLSLEGSKLDLSDAAYKVDVSINNALLDVQILNGELEFIRTQNLLIDGVHEEIILSGVFEFQALIDGEPVTVSSGRFDVGVSKSNFFVL